MDPRMFKLLGFTLMAPMEAPDGDFGGGGDDGDEEREDGDSDDDEDDESDGDDDDPDDDESQDDDEDEDESDEDEDDSGDDDPEDEDLGKLSQRTQKRIKKLVAQTKDLQRQIDDARKLGGDDGKAIMAAATKAGILPSLMTKDLAAGLEDLADKKDALAYFGNLLDSDDDEFEIGGKTFSRRQIERKERALTGEVRDLESQFGKGRDKAVADAKELFELGLAAKKAGWKPGKASEKTKKKPNRDKPKETAAPKHKAHKRSVSYEDVTDDDSLEAMIAAERRKKG